MCQGNHVLDIYTENGLMPLYLQLPECIFAYFFSDEEADLRASKWDGFVARSWRVTWHV
jgi:hypothetical protein